MAERYGENFWRQDVHADNRLAFAVYMLTGELEHWWINMKSIMEEREEQDESLFLSIPLAFV